MLKMLKIFLLLFLIASCRTIEISHIENFDKEYKIDTSNMTEEEIYQHAIIVGTKEIIYLRSYINILILRLKSSNKHYIQIIDLRED